MNLKALLISGLDKLQLDLNNEQIEALLAYISLLEKWNRRYNLTAIRDPEKMLAYHLLDSLSILNWVEPQSRALDVGSGPGLPGIPLAIALPDSQWHLLDSSSKKTRFMQQALATCAVNNATVVNSRVQDYHAREALDIIVSRAYASLRDFAESVAHLMQPGTRLMTMKTGLEDEAVLTTTQFEQQEYDLQVPGVSEPRKLVMVRQR